MDHYTALHTFGQGGAVMVLYWIMRRLTKRNRRSMGIDEFAIPTKPGTGPTSSSSGPADPPTHKTAA